MAHRSEFEDAHMMSDKEQAEVYRQGMISAQQALVMQDKRAETQYQTARDEVVLLQKQLEKLEFVFAQVRQQRDQSLELAKTRAVELEECQAAFDIARKKLKFVSHDSRPWRNRYEMASALLETQKDRISELEARCDNLIRTGIAVEKQIVDAYQATADKTTELDECRAANAAFATQYGVKSVEVDEFRHLVEQSESKARDSRLDSQTRSTVCEALRTTIAELKMQVSENETNSDLCLAAVKETEKQAQDLSRALTCTEKRLSASLSKQEMYKSALIRMGCIVIDGDLVDSFEDEVNNE